jgi:acyl-CoA thioester hydrolase
MTDGTAINVYCTRVRAHQTDLNGAMYHGAFLDVFDDARIETFRRLGYDYRRMTATTFRPVIRRIECDYRAPAFMDDPLQITVLVERLTAATMTIRYEGRREGDMIAIGHATFAFIDREGKPGRIPDDLRETARTPALQPVT